jgi:hypothetical protein
VKERADEDCHEDQYISVHASALAVGAPAIRLLDV